MPKTFRTTVPPQQFAPMSLRLPIDLRDRIAADATVKGDSLANTLRAALLQVYPAPETAPAKKPRRKIAPLEPQ